MQRWQEKNREFVHDPWFSIWRNPRETMREILDLDPRRHVFLLAVVAGFVEALEWAVNENLGDDYSLFMVLSICAVAGAAGGVLVLHAGAYLLQRIGAWLGGTASFGEMRATVAWSSVPLIWTLLFWLPAIFIFGNTLFQNKNLELPNDILVIPPLLVIGIVAIIIGIWMIYIFINCLAEAHRFSIWRSVVTATLTFILIIMVIIAVALPIELFTS